MAELSVNTLRELLDYDADTGVLIWRWRDRSWFKTNQAFSRWNHFFAGKPALNSPHKSGYLHGMILYKLFLAHRVAFAIHKGYWPVTLDHINGDKTDNSLANLREVSRSINSKNARKYRNNTSGVCGVTFDRASGKWRAYLQSDGVFEHLGLHPTLDAAASARKAAEIGLGFTERHGADQHDNHRPKQETV